jgi:hypothetical protein
VLQKFGIFGALFEALSYLGLNCGVPRMPRLPLTPDECVAFHKALDAVDFHTLAAM